MPTVRLVDLWEKTENNYTHIVKEEAGHGACFVQCKFRMSVTSGPTRSIQMSVLCSRCGKDTVVPYSCVTGIAMVRKS